MSNIPSWRSEEDGLPQHSTSNIDSPRNLTDYITKIGDQFVAGGGFGDVYRCRYLNGSTSENVAVKALRFKPDKVTKDKFDRMVRRELGIWKRLDHGNIVPFLGIAYGFGMEDTISLVSLWMSNDTLHNFLDASNDKLEVVHRLQILLDIAKGLKYLHSFQPEIVHGDLYCYNVLIDADYTARLADFGYASMVGNVPEELGYLQRFTAGRGALRWNAPEQINPKGPFIRTTKSDIYSFGCIALEVFSREEPWADANGDADVILRLHQGDRPGRPESRAIDDSHWNFIDQCWSPVQKRPSADTIISSIQVFLSEYPSSRSFRDLFISSSSQAQDSLSSELRAPHKVQNKGTDGLEQIDFVIPLFTQDLTPYIIKLNDHIAAGGGFGDVYRCRYLNGSTSEEVAVKALRFRPDQATKDRFYKMVRRELGIWKRLDHGNIVPFLGIAYGFGMEGTISLVSLWMPNGTLHKFLATNDDKLDVVHRLQILLDVAKGLDYLHSFPIVHGDLNSNNVLLDANYTARLADFGYASLMGNIPEALGYLQRSTARPGALRWIAPEQIDLEGSSIRTTMSDIYSFGCIALEVLSGKQPWSEVREDVVVVLHLQKGHKPGRPESRVIDNSHWNVIQRCWSPLQKRPSAAEIIKLLNGYPRSPPRDLFISPSNQARDSLSTSSLNPAAARPPSVLAAASSPLSPPSPPPAQDLPGLPTDLAVSSINSSAPRAPHKVQNEGMDGLEAAPVVRLSNRNAAGALRADTSPTPPPSQSSYPRNWLAFTRPLADLLNKIKRNFSSSPTMDISENDIVVFIVGPTGSGKSWFTNTATKCDLVNVSRDQHPFTSNIQAIPCELTDGVQWDLQEIKSIVFVDTPSFLTGCPKPDPYKEFKAWFSKIKYKPRHVGVIYMHRVETDPVLRHINAHLQEFTSVLPIVDARFPQRLLVVVSHDKASSIIPESKITQRISDLRDQVDLLHQSRGRWYPSSVHEELFRGEPEVAWRAVEELFRYL